MIDVALICSTMPARLKQFRRSCETWVNDANHSGLNVKLCIWNEGLDDPLNYDMHEAGLGMDAYAGQRELSGSHIKGYNYWFEKTDAKVYLFTHPDLLFPKGTIQTAYLNALDNVYVTFKCLWMSPDMTRDIDKFHWRNPETLEHEPMMYELDELLKGSFYANRTVRDIKTWDSSTTHAVSRATAQKMYPIPELGHQGYDDPYQLALRGLLNISNFTVQDPILVHQHHENSWHGTGGEAVQEAAQLIEQYKKEGLK